MRLAVILPVYNAESYLDDCIQSLLNQTFSDFCILAVNDCSTDNSEQILENYAKQDSRLRVYHFDKNQDEPGAVKFAMDMTYLMQVDYVARMDSDDICLPERFQKQIKYLDQHPEIAVLGTNIQFIDNKNQSRGQSNLPCDDVTIKANLIRARGNIANPTSMWRLSWFKKFSIHYGLTKTACDYAMWVDCAIHQAKFANLGDILVKYRLHDQQMSRKFNDINQAVQITLEKYIYTLFPQLSPVETTNLTAICHGAGSISLTLDKLNSAFKAFEKIKQSTNDDIHKQAILKTIESRVNFWKSNIHFKQAQSPKVTFKVIKKS